jgi:hypothetical protein
MFGGPLVYCALLFSFDFYLTDSSIYVYMSHLVGRWIANQTAQQNLNGFIFMKFKEFEPVTVAERSKAYTVFACSEAGILGSNPTQGMDIWYVYVFILCLCCPEFR